MEKDENKKTNSNNSNNEKKFSFLKQVKVSITKFDGYNMFTKQTFKQCALYLISIVAIFALLTAFVSIFNYSKLIGNIVNYFESNISTLTYKDGQLSVNDNNKIVTDDLNKEVGKLIVDTSDVSETQLNEYTDELSSATSGFAFLKDKFLIKNLNSISQVSYSDALKSANINSLDKQGVIDYLTNNKTNLYSGMLITMFIYIFFSLLLNSIIDVAFLSLLCFICAKVSKLGIKFVQSINIAIHALTLPLLLNMVYIIVNTLTGFVVKYFQVMYLTIACIYIITALLMMKSDSIKKEVEIQKIKTEQEKIKEELAKKKIEEKEQQEKDEIKDKDKKKEKKSNKKNKKVNAPINDKEKPEGDNA